MAKAYLIQSDEMKILPLEIIDFEAIEKAIGSEQIEGVHIASNLIVYFDGIANLREEPPESGFVLKDLQFELGILWGLGVVIQVDDEGRYRDISMSAKDFRKRIVW